jgi:ferredoxin
VAFFEVPEIKSGVARKDEDGKRSIAFPSLTGGNAEEAVTLSSCAGCSKLASHCPSVAIGVDIDVGETRHQRVPSENRFSAAEGMKLQAAMWVLWYMTNGHIGNEIRFNYGDGGNNASQVVRYEIVSASGFTLTLKGPNPKRVVIGRLDLNPDWPLSDEGRLQASQVTRCIPVGAGVEFEWPSVHYRNNRPFITAINPPASDAEDDVTFTVEVSNRVSNADRHFDGFFDTAGRKYFCKIRWEALVPGVWKNFQAVTETQWAEQSMTFESAGTVELLDGNDASTRVLFESMLPGALSATLALQGGGTEARTGGWVEARLTTTQTGAGAWETMLDVSDLDFVSTYDSITVTYHAEAVSGDTGRFFFQGSCGNAQKDYSGSYVVGDGERHCTDPDSTGFDNFEDVCWQPGCSGFTLRRLDGSVLGQEIFPADSPDDPKFWSGLAMRNHWVVTQSVEGVASFTLTVPAGGGPSHAALCGGFRDEVPTGKFPERYPYHAPQWGQVKLWGDGEGETPRFTFVQGAWFAKPYDDSGDGGPSYIYDAANETASMPEEGVIADEVAGWNTKTDPRGESMERRVEKFPAWFAGSMNVYQYAHDGGSIARTNKLHETGEKFVTGAAIDGGERADVASVVLRRFGV